MKVIFEKQPTDTITVEEVTNDHIIVAEMNPYDWVILCALSFGSKEYQWISLNEYFTKHNGYGPVRTFKQCIHNYSDKNMYAFNTMAEAIAFLNDKMNKEEIYHCA